MADSLFMGSPNRTSEVRERADSELASRSLQGLWGNPATVILSALTTTLPQEHPKVFLALVEFTLAVAITRAILLASRKNLHPSLHSSWRKLLLGNIILSAASWGGIAAFTIHSYPFGHPNITCVVLYTAAIAGAGVHLLVEKVSLALTYSVIILAPPFVVCLGDAGLARYIALPVVYYFIYLAGQSRRSTRSFWIGIQDNVELSRLAHHDPLTGLSNRLALERNVASALDRANPDQRICLLYIDLDRFKQINDRFSHRIGDLLLTEIAARLRASVDSDATVCRLGGDEFCVFLAGRITESEAQRIADQILQALCRPARIEGIDITPSASIGISFHAAVSADLKELLRAADHAMYLAKAVDGGCIRTTADLAPA